jgi:hypothetical protein
MKVYWGYAKPDLWNVISVSAETFGPSSLSLSYQTQFGKKTNKRKEKVCGREFEFIHPIN